MGIVGGILLGLATLFTVSFVITVAIYAAIITVKWIYNKVRDLIRNKHAKKVAVCDIQELAKKCKNTASLSELETLANRGCTHCTVGLDENNNVIDDPECCYESKNYDAEVDRLINRTREGMVVFD